MAMGSSKMVRLIHDKGNSHTTLVASVQSLLENCDMPTTLTMMMIEKIQWTLHESLKRNTTYRILILVYLHCIQYLIYRIIQFTNTCII